jgi:hypothetical protein
MSIKQLMRLGRRIGISISGGVVMAAGAVLAVPLVPGPGLALVLLGLGILSLEFEWPRLWLARMKAYAVKLKNKVRSKLPSGRA